MDINNYSRPKRTRLDLPERTLYYFWPAPTSVLGKTSITSTYSMRAYATLRPRHKDGYTRHIEHSDSVSNCYHSSKSSSVADSSTRDSFKAFLFFLPRIRLIFRHHGSRRRHLGKDGRIVRRNPTPLLYRNPMTDRSDL